MAQRHDQYAACSDHRRDIRHRSLALRLVQVHPNGGDEHEVELLTAFQSPSQLGKAIVAPLDLVRSVELHCGDAKFVGRFDREYSMSLISKKCGIRPGSCADVKDVAGIAAKQVEHVPMLFSKGYCLRSFDELVCLVAVALSPPNQIAPR